MRAGNASSRKFPALDDFRLIAVILVVANHTRSADGSFLWLLTVLRRVAVPYFLMVSGYFLGRDDWRSTGRFLKKTALLYGIAVLLYLPLNWYAGQLSPDFIRQTLFDGSFYHLWYLPALLLGAPIAYLLNRLGQRKALLLAGGLYLIGLGGDSYYGLLPESVTGFYDMVFRVFTYARNGLFYVPLFLLLGAAGFTLGRRLSLAGFLLSLSMLVSEALLLHGAGVQRFDSMYLCFPFLMVCLFSLLLRFNQGERREFRHLTTLVYLLHPWCIVLVRRGAEAVELTALLVENTFVHFLAVLALSLFLSHLLLLAPPPRPYPKARAWIELDRAALRQNVEQLRSLLPEGCALMPAVKANAYGHGAVLIARELGRLGIRAFCVATAEEGAELRGHGIRGDILVLGHTYPGQFPLLRRYRLTQTVVDTNHARLLNASGKRLKVHLKIDTGMHRLGIPAAQTAEIARIFQLKNLQIEGIFTHLCADERRSGEDEAYTLLQAAAFYKVLSDLEKQGLPYGKAHLLSSYGLLNYPELGGAYARVGIALYGVLSSREGLEGCPLALRPVLSLKVRVASVKNLRKGEHAGYGLGYTAACDRRIALLSIGYADGFPRALSCGRGKVLINGVEAPVIGRVCMDQTLVDVTDASDVKSGDTAVVIGVSGQREISAYDWSEAGETITNEVLSRLSTRLRRTTR